MSVVDDSYGHPLEHEERASSPLMGGMLLKGYQCGMLWGTAMAAGAQAYRAYGPGPKAESAALLAAQQLALSFQKRYRHTDCYEMTGLKFDSISPQNIPLKQAFQYIIRKGGPVGCFSMSVRYARMAVREIDAAYNGNDFIVPASPVSCSAVLAQKLGLSEMQTVMAAGLAGGIGLSGSACGALGAAVWVTGMKCLEEGVDGDLWFSEVFQSRAAERVDRFLESADNQYECVKIVGRRFENIDDHAAYLHAGGCAKIIEALAV